ncbi:hypothetical protein JZX76_00950 [Haloarcula hispanica]|uniref:DUF8129 domain-containing protein n=1 Tax=Haloarcula hispanica TaxID=51589 RepID=A0A482TK76_HALHI|nr:hypothetical protein [Haloarcula hispanica]MCJ0618144.1 hypothetical protein [Haloarcula hispanica]RYJ15658.1 hypothetical protein ELS20_00980 [Haloarcula hispanica]
MSDTPDPILDKLPPERLLDADHLQPIVAGINCMHSMEAVQQYLAYENKHQNRTPVQSRLRERAREIRRDESEAEEQAVA